MVEALCRKFNKVDFNEPPNKVDSLIKTFEKIKIHEKEPFLVSILNKMKQMPKVPLHVRKNMQKDREILEARNKRERRKLAKLVCKSQQIQHNEIKTSETENNIEEEYIEVYEESFLDSETGHPFDIDNFNDE